MKEDSISEDSFVAIEVDSFDSAGESIPATGSIFNIMDATVTKVTMKLERYLLYCWRQDRMFDFWICIECGYHSSVT